MNAETVQGEINPDEVRDALAQLDGTTRSAVKLLTGLDDATLDELGGFREEES